MHGRDYEIGSHNNNKIIILKLIRFGHALRICTILLFFLIHVTENTIQFHTRLLAGLVDETGEFQLYLPLRYRSMLTIISFRTSIVTLTLFL